MDSPSIQHEDSPPNAIHKSVNCVLVRVQLNRCVDVCGSVLHMGHFGDGCYGECGFRVMYVEWLGVCNFVVFLVLRYLLTMLVCMCFMFVLVCVLGFVLMSVV